MNRKPRSITKATTTQGVTRTRRSVLAALLAATAMIAGCVSAGDRVAGAGGAVPFVAGSPGATATPDVDAGNGGGLVLQPATTLEEFRTRWNEMAARSAASDPFGIFRLDPATGEKGIRIDWPDEHMTLDVAFDPATSLVRTIALTRSPGGQDRDAFVHVMAVLIAVSTPGQSLDLRVALYGRLGDASTAAGGGPFRLSVVDDALTFTLMSAGHGDATLTVAPLGWAKQDWSRERDPARSHRVGDRRWGVSTGDRERAYAIDVDGKTVTFFTNRADLLAPDRAEFQQVLDSIEFEDAR